MSRRMIAALGGSALLLAAGTAAVLVLSNYCQHECLSAESDLAYLDDLRQDHLLVTPPPNEHGRRAVLPSACYPSGGWFGSVDWKTSASDDEIVAFYQGAVSRGWDVDTSAKDDYLLTLEREGDGPNEAVRVSIRRNRTTADKIVLIVDSDRLLYACIEEKTRRAAEPR